MYFKILAYAIDANDAVEVLPVFYLSDFDNVRIQCAKDAAEAAWDMLHHLDRRARFRICATCRESTGYWEMMK